MRKFCRNVLLGITQFLSFATMSFSQQPASVPTSEQTNLETQFDSYLQRDNLRAWMKRLSARPHHTGSAYGKANAEFIAEQFRSWGYEARLEEFHVLFPTPKTRVLEMVAPQKFRAKLEEPALKEDATSNQQKEQLPVYNAYSMDGEVTGELVYVNYGVPKDYEELEMNGVNVKGRIVIARYGGSWRGIKPKVAAEHGAIGCLIYSDPRDDGYFEGDVYPKGAFRNEFGAQRGSVADMPLYPGDPLTPGVGATKEAKRYAVQEAPTLTKIPVMPISYGDALPLLRELAGPVAPEAWRGALPITYHLGPGPAKAHLQLEFNWEVVPIYNVIATMAGSEDPEQWIIRGNHHDAWVNGAQDPISGLVALMEEARGIAELAKTGWKPRRTIIYCAWDAEEPGLLGSTEWAEAHADELKQKAVVYINSDSNGRGFLGMGGSHTLETFMNEVAREVIDPQKKINVAERLRALRIMNSKGEELEEVRNRRDLRLAALGSGSDYTPFLQHLGIASLNLGYGGENDGGSYHSVYDSFDHYTRFGDPNFDYGIALAQTAGRVVLRLAHAQALPFEFNNFAETVARYAKEVMKLTEDMRKETEEKNRRIREGTLAAVADPAKAFVMPQTQPPVPYLNFAPLQNAVAKLQESARGYEGTRNALQTNGSASSANVSKSLNSVLIQMERHLTRNEGLPRRPWFVHQIYAPGFYTGYGVKTLPAVREAIEQRNWQEAGEQIEVVAKTITDYAQQLDRATAIAQTAAQ
ncbi:MAG: M28 family metallopeptidase [bacterium]